MQQVPFRLLMAGNKAVEGAAKIDIQGLHAPADAEHWPAGIQKGANQLLLVFAERAVDVTAAGQQKPCTQSGICRVCAAHGTASGGENGPGIAAQLLPAAGDKDGWDHEQPSLSIETGYGRGGRVMPGYLLRQEEGDTASSSG